MNSDDLDHELNDLTRDQIYKKNYKKKMNKFHNIL